MKLQKRSLKNNTTYDPAEDTFFLDDYIRHEAGYSALDIGSGSGYLTKSLTQSFSVVVGTDINFYALQDQTYKTENIICCDGASALYTEFDLIICNLPYLATNEILDPTTDGGKGGLEVPLHIMQSVLPLVKSGGKFVFVTSSLSDYAGLIEYVKSRGLATKIVSRKKLFFEELILIEATKSLS